jgi:hypothetical protein
VDFSLTTKYRNTKDRNTNTEKQIQLFVSVDDITTETNPKK